MPDSYRGIAVKLLGSAVALRIFNRRDIVWSAGGTYSQPFASEVKFAEFFNERRSPEFFKHGLRNVPILPMERRQVQYISFKGEIVRHRPVLSNSVPEVIRSYTFF